MWRQNQIQTKIINKNRKICDDHVESRTLRFTMIRKQCEEKKLSVMDVRSTMTTFITQGGESPGVCLIRSVKRGAILYQIRLPEL